MTEFPQKWSSPFLPIEFFKGLLQGGFWGSVEASLNLFYHQKNSKKISGVHNTTSTTLVATSDAPQATLRGHFPFSSNF